MPAKERKLSKLMYNNMSMYDGAQMTYFESLLFLFLLHALTKCSFEDLFLVALFILTSAKWVSMKRISIDIFPHMPRFPIAVTVIHFLTKLPQCHVAKKLVLEELMGLCIYH